MPKISINDKEVSVPEGITIIQACEISDVEIPRFCYHERLKIAGNCRMCLVEVEGGPPKPVASCAMPVNEGMKIHTDTPMVKKAREGVMEFLLANHPLDCPICDQGGECDLQDQAYQYGRGVSDFDEHKRAVKDKDMGPLIKTHMTRCIHCTRCVRFIEDVAGTCEIGAVNRGENMEITTYLEKSIASELSGNVIDLCPVGALTSKPYAFKSRSWELKKTESIDVMDALGSNIRIDSRGIEVLRILPRLNEEINEEWISDKARFCYDGLKYQRLDKAYIKENSKLKATSLDEACKKVANKIKDANPENVIALSGPLSSLEDVFSLKKLINKIGSNNHESRINNEKFDAKDQSSYLFNTSIAGIEEATTCLLIGVNPRKDAPVLNSRIRKSVINNNLKVAAIGVDADLTYNYENLGSNVEILQNILDAKSEYSQILEKSAKPMIILGSDVVSRQDGDKIINLSKEIAKKYNAIQNNFNGFNFLAKSTGLVNGLETGFVSEKGIDGLLNNAKEKIVILHALDDNIDLEKLKDSFVIYIGSHGDKSAHIADIILPAPAYSEKDSSFVNLEGRRQKSLKAVSAPGEAIDDYLIFLKIAKNLGLDLEFNDFSSLQKLISKELPNVAEFDQITKRPWQDATKADGKFSDEVISAKDYDFYLTNPIARASRTMNKCS